MGFGKAFGLGLLIYVALNFVFALIGALLANQIDVYFGLITTDPMTFISSLFAPILILPGIAWLTTGILAILAATPDAMLLALMVMIGLIVPPILAAIIAGRTGESKGAAFGAWFLIAIICAVVPLVLGIIAGSLSVDVIIIITFILSGVINGIFYGAIAALSASEGF